MKDWHYLDYDDKQFHSVDLIKCKCPICPDTTFGSRLPDETKTFKCKDCNTEYTFYPTTDKPSSKVLHLQPDRCNCPSCRERDKLN